MVSNDNQQYVTAELFNSKMETFLTQIKLDNEKSRNELGSKIQTVQSELNSKIDNAQSELNSKIQIVQSGLHSEIQEGLSNLHNEIQVVQSGVNVNSAQNIDIQHSIYWGFSVLAIICAIIPYFKRERKEEKQSISSLTREEVINIVNSAVSKAVPSAVAEAVSQAVNEAVAQALCNIHAVGKQ